MSKGLCSNKELLIFDWDGTLIDSHDYIIDSMLLAAQGVGLVEPSREQVSAIIGMSMVPAIQTLFPELDEQEVINFRAVYTQHYDNESRAQPKLFEGVYKGLERLHGWGYELAIATGKRRPGLQSGLEYTQTVHFFGELRTADDCLSKPSPEMVLSILESYQISAEQCLVFGDNVLDIQMAKAAGVDSIGLGTGSSSLMDMERVGARFCFENFTETLSLFER